MLCQLSYWCICTRYFFKWICRLTLRCVAASAKFSQVLMRRKTYNYDTLYSSTAHSLLVVKADDGRHHLVLFGNLLHLRVSKLYQRVEPPHVRVLLVVWNKPLSTRSTSSFVRRRPHLLKYRLSTFNDRLVHLEHVSVFLVEFVDLLESGGKFLLVNLSQQVLDTEVGVVDARRRVVYTLYVGDQAVDIAETVAGLPRSKKPHQRSVGNVLDAPGRTVAFYSGRLSVVHLPLPLVVVGIVHFARLNLPCRPRKRRLALCAPHLVTAVDFEDRSCALWARLARLLQQRRRLHIFFLALVSVARCHHTLLADTQPAQPTRVSRLGDKPTTVVCCTLADDGVDSQTRRLCRLSGRRTVDRRTGS